MSWWCSLTRLLPEHNFHEMCWSDRSVLQNTLSKSYNHPPHILAAGSENKIQSSKVLHCVSFIHKKTLVQTLLVISFQKDAYILHRCSPSFNTSHFCYSIKDSKEALFFWTMFIAKNVINTMIWDLKVLIWVWKVLTQITRRNALLSVKSKQFSFKHTIRYKVCTALYSLSQTL